MTAATALRSKCNACYYCASYYDSNSSNLFFSSPSPNKKRTPLSLINQAQGSAILMQVHNDGIGAKALSSVFDTLKKKASSSVVDTLKENIKINHECYLYSTFLPNLVRGMIGTPMLVHTLIVTDPMMQLMLYKSQVAICRGARHKTCSLFTNLTSELFFYQCAPKEFKGIEHGPTNHSFNRTTCLLHTDLTYLKRSDIRPDNSTKLPIALNTNINKELLQKVIQYLDDFTAKIRRIKTNPYCLHLICFMQRNNMGRHGDSLRRSEW